jgi:cation:H+ antiporter
VLTFLFLLGGLALLIAGGDLLVRGSVRLAERLGLSPLLIGLTLVGLGTSTPEMMTSVQAALMGSPGIAVGNIVGSNLANLLLVLGASALIFPMTVQSQALKRDGGFVVATALIFLVVGLVAGLSRPVGIALLALLVGYLVFAYRQESAATGPGADHTAAFDRAEAMESADPALRPHPAQGSGLAAWLVPAAMAAGGFAAIIVGSRLLVLGAVDAARIAGLSEEVIGLTVVAFGTSMPELVTSVMAAFRRQADVALGNILGSNIYNVLAIGGLTALIAPTQVPRQIAFFDAPAMVAVSVLLFVFALTGARLSRVEGAILVALYAAYLAWLVFA